MTDLDLLLGKFDRGELLRPDHAVPNVVDLARALARQTGVEGVATTPGVAAIASRIGPTDHLIFVLADGFGLNLFNNLPSTSFLAQQSVNELRSIFPSTTATVLTSLATGEWPSQHGVTGQWTHLSEINGTAALLPFASRSGGRLLTHLGVTAEQVFPLRPLLSKMTRDVLALFPTTLVHSVSSIYFSGSQPMFGYETLVEAVDRAIAHIDAADRPTYTYIYYPRIDSEAHWLGVGHRDVGAVVNELDRCIERLSDGVRDRGKIVVGADHGLADSAVSARHGFKPSADLFESLRYGPSGDDRVLYFHVREGGADRFRRGIKQRFGDRFLLISIEEAEALHLFGPELISPARRDRFGDILMISSGSDMIEYAPTGRVGRRTDLNAFHSGLSPDEMRVPLIVID